MKPRHQTPLRDQYIHCIFIRTVSRERTFDYNIDYSLMKKADEDFRHTVSIKLDKLPAKRD